MFVKQDKEQKETIQKSPFTVNILELGMQFGLIIAIPLLMLIGLGFYLDKKFGTVPLFILIGLFSALAISSTILYVEIKKINETLNNKSNK